MKRIVLLTILYGALMTLAAGLAQAAPQPEPLCVEEVRMDAGAVAPCSGIGVPLDTYQDCIECANARANPCILEKAEAEGLRAELAAEREKHAKTEAARLAAEAALIPTPPPVPPAWYERPGFWVGVGTVAAAIGGMAATEDHPAWWALGGVGLGVAISEAAR